MCAVVQPPVVGDRLWCPLPNSWCVGERGRDMGATTGPSNPSVGPHNCGRTPCNAKTCWQHECGIIMGALPVASPALAPMSPRAGRASFTCVVVLALPRVITNGPLKREDTHAAARRSRGQAYGETDGLWLSNATVTVLGMRRLVIKYDQECCYNPVRIHISTRGAIAPLDARK